MGKSLLNDSGSPGGQLGTHKLPSEALGGGRLAAPGDGAGRGEMSLRRSDETGGARSAFPARHDAAFFVRRH